MSEMELFKTAWMGGYDKVNVQEQIQKLKEESIIEQERLKEVINEKEARIQELQKLQEMQEARQKQFEAEVEEKYQKYIDNYDSIGKLIFESRIKADAMIKEAEIQKKVIIQSAEEKKKIIIQAAREKAEQWIETVHLEVNEKLSDGKKKYLKVYDEMNEVVGLINQAQRRFMSSYKTVHKVINMIPDSLEDSKTEEPETDALPDEAIPVIETAVMNISGKEEGLTSVGDALEYIITVSNDRTDTMWENVVVIDFIPKGVNLENGDICVNGEAAEFIYDEETRELTVFLGDIGGGKEDGTGKDVKVITFPVRIDESAYNTIVKNKVLAKGDEGEAMAEDTGINVFFDMMIPSS